MTANQLRYRYKELLKDTGLRYVNFQGLRHAAASFWLTEGMSLRKVQELLGHSTFVLTAKQELLKSLVDDTDSVGPTEESLNTTENRGFRFRTPT